MKTTSSKFLKVLLPVVVLLIMLSGCDEVIFKFYKPYLGKRPIDQPGSSWSSQEGTITFTVDEDSIGRGKMTVSGEEIEMCFITGLGVSIEISSPDMKTIYEKWLGDFKNDKSFVATVNKSTYFEEGMEITFNRVDTLEETACEDAYLPGTTDALAWGDRRV